MGKGLRSDPLNLFLNFYQSSKRSLTYHDVQQHIYCAAVVVASCRSLPAPPSVVQAARHRPSCRAESATLSLTQIQVSASTVGHPQLLAGQTLRQKERGVELGSELARPRASRVSGHRRWCRSIWNNHRPLKR